mgnify:CR=1 FL=1
MKHASFRGSVPSVLPWVCRRSTLVGMVEPSLRTTRQATLAPVPPNLVTASIPCLTRSNVACDTDVAPGSTT